MSTCGPSAGSPMSDVRVSLVDLDRQGTVLAKKELTDLLPHIQTYCDWLTHSPKIRHHEYKLKFKFGVPGSDPGQLKSPSAVAIGKDGTIIVAECSLNRIQLFDHEGSYLKTIGTRLFYPHGLAVNDLGNILVTQIGTHTVQVLDPAGEPLFKFGSKGKGQSQFDSPVDVATDYALNIYVVDARNSRVQVFDSKGTFKFQFGSPGSGAGQFASPVSIAVNQTSIYVGEQNSYRLQVFSLSGQYLRHFGAGGSVDDMVRPRAVAVDRDGTALVLDQFNSRMHVLDSNGASLMTIADYGSRSGHLCRPTGLALHGSLIYVADTENNRVQCFE